MDLQQTTLCCPLLSHCAAPPLRMLLLLSTAAAGLTAHLCCFLPATAMLLPPANAARSCFSYPPIMLPTIYRGSCRGFPGSYYFLPPSPPPPLLLLIHSAACCCCPTNAFNADFRGCWCSCPPMLLLLQPVIGHHLLLLILSVLLQIPLLLP